MNSQAVALYALLQQLFAPKDRAIPIERPYGLTSAFATDPGKRQQWISFGEAIEADLPSLQEIVDDLAAFLMPYVKEVQTL
jgi:hypothetical protein